MEITLIQQIKAQVGPTNPASTAASPTILAKDIDIDLTSRTSGLGDELATNRFILSVGAVDQPLCLGTIAEAKMLYLDLDSPLLVKLVNSGGTTQDLLVGTDFPAMIPITFTQILVSNPSPDNPVKGLFFVIGT